MKHPTRVPAATLATIQKTEPIKITRIAEFWRVRLHSGETYRNSNSQIGALKPFRSQVAHEQCGDLRQTGTGHELPGIGPGIKPELFKNADAIVETEAKL